MILHSGKQRALIILAAMVLIAAAAVLLRDRLQPDDATAQARAHFVATCKEQGRMANGGGAQLRMDDATEEGLDLYCSCVADHFDRVLSPAEITAVGAGTASPEVMARLNAVVGTCQAQHLAPAPEPAASQPGSGASP